MNDEYTIVRVTMTRDLLIPDYIIREYGGLGMVMYDWYTEHAGTSHAARDSCVIGNSDTMINWEKIDIDDLPPMRSNLYEEES